MPLQARALRRAKGRTVATRYIQAGVCSSILARTGEFDLDFVGKVCANSLVAAPLLLCTLQLQLSVHVNNTGT